VSDKISDSSANYVLLTRLADEFAARYRAGERPALQDYIDRHPELADDIREMFPAMVEMEQVREDHDEGAAQVAEPAPTLQQLGDFRIIREVGKGGMGIVYEAEQVSLGRHVALKVLPSNLLPDARAKRRFEREAKAAARLHHTNIVPVFGVGEQDGTPYYVMQFIQGLGLDEVLEELKKLQLATAKTGSLAARPVRASLDQASAVNVARSLLTGEFNSRAAANPAALAATETAAGVPAEPAPRPPSSSDSLAQSSSVILPGRSRDGSSSRHRKQSYWQSVASIGVQVADALEYAHKQGINHRDIKPSNLLLDRQGTVWVTDFGLAKADDQQNLTHTGDVLGTLRYMPPEAFEGKTDARGDVYSLGLTLYELLAFRPAFAESERNRLIKQVTNEEPASLGKLNRQVPRDLETIVHKAIEKDKDRRYASAAALAEDLRRFIADEPIKARRINQTERFWRWCRRNPLVAGLTAMLVLVFLTGFASVAWKWQEAQRQRDIAEAAVESEAAQRAVAVAQADVATREADRSRHLLYASDINLALQAWDRGDTGRARELLEKQWPEPGQADLRGFEWRYLWPRCQDGSRLSLLGHRAGVARIGLSLAADGRTLASCGSDHRICIWDLESGRHTRLLNLGAQAATFAPDSKTLAIAEANALRLWDVRARCTRAIFPNSSWGFSVAFSADGKLLAVGGMGIVRIWDVATHRELDHFEVSFGPVLGVAFSPDGKTVASGGVDATVRLWNVTARRLLATLRGHTEFVTGVTFSPDSKVLASISHDATVCFWDAVSGQRLKTIRGQSIVLSLAFAHDGKTFITANSDGTIRVWDTATGEVAAMLRGHTGPVWAVALAADGRRLVSAGEDGTVKVWDLGPRPDPNILTNQIATARSVAFSPDGKTLAVTDNSGMSIKLWDMPSRRLVATLRGHFAPVAHVTFASDGRSLVSTGYDSAVCVWAVAARKRVYMFRHASASPSAALSPDGKLLAAGSFGGEEVRVWELASRRQVAPPISGHHVQFSPDGKWLAAASDDAVRLWEVATWHEAAALIGQQTRVSCLAFAPDGKTLATGDWDGMLRLWDLAGKREIAKRRGHTSGVPSVAFAPLEGGRLASAGVDSTVKLWDAGSLQEIATLTGHAGPVNSLTFSPDGDLLATASSDGTVRLWPAPPLPATHPAQAALTSTAPAAETIHLFTLEQHGAAQARLIPEGTADRVEIRNVDGTDWHVMVQRLFDDPEEGATYMVRFRARADAPCHVRVAATNAVPPWHNTGLNRDVNLTKEWQPFEFTFQATDLAAWNRIDFSLGQGKRTVWIADFALTKGAN
jgi:WD40 repeat protein/serine/threonine protein kinase